MQYDIDAMKAKLAYYKDAKKKWLYRYNTRETTKPNSERKANTQLPPQMSKCGLIQGFGEDICELVLASNIAKVNVSSLNMISQKMISHIYVFGF